MLKDPGSPCWFCTAPRGRWNEPGSAEHPELAAAQLRALERWLEELERGRVTAACLHAELLRMCAMCQEVVADAGVGASAEELEGRLRFRIERLRTELSMPRAC